MSDNISVLLIGASQMAIDYFNVLKALNISTTIIGRSIEGAKKFEAATGTPVITGGLEKYIQDVGMKKHTHAIVAVGLEELSNTTLLLIQQKVKYILLEKPGGLDFPEIENLAKSNNKDSKIFIAYNRRFYQSVLKAQEIIAADGGVKSFHFEFTEWSHVIGKIDKKVGIKENWFLANSTHVVDLAFYLGGYPKEMQSYTSGSLDWHPKSIFVGSGISDKNALFSYHSNWESPGRWFVEILTAAHRLILKPMEELYVQEKGSIQVNKLELDSDLDKQFKAGLFLQTKAFVEGSYNQLLTLEAHAKKLEILKQIVGFQN
jgi:predicted dehydrogenase